MNFYSDFSLFSDEEILEKVLPAINDVFNQYFFLPCSNEEKKEITKKVIRKSRVNYDGSEFYIDYLKKNISLYLDDYIKFLFNKKSKLSAIMLNKYLESLPDVNSLEEAIDILNKLTIFVNRYDYSINRYMIYRLLEYNNKFLEIVSFCIKEQDKILKNNDLIKLIIESYYEKLNNDMYNADSRECQTSYNAYIKEVTNIPLLSVEEEKKLICEYKNGNLEARDKIIEANLRMVISIANKHVGYGLPFEDLIQEGNLGLMTALDNYKIEKNSKFSTYAYYWIRCSIIRAIKTKSKMIRIPDYVYNQMLKFKKAKKKLEIELMRSVTVEEMADYLNIPLKKAIALYNSIYEPGSLNVYVGDEDEKEMGDSKISEDFIPEEEIMKQDYKDVVQDMLKTANLKEKELETIYGRYGFNGNIMLVSELAKQFGVSHTYVSYLEKRALKRIKEMDNIDYYRNYFRGKQK